MTVLEIHRLLWALALAGVLWCVQMPHVRLWMLSVAIAFDRFINAVLVGSCDETLSSRAYRAWRDGKAPGKWLKVVIDAIFRVLISEKDHCSNAWHYEALRLRPETMMDTAGIALSETLRKS